jgi:hypothetical protein
MSDAALMGIKTRRVESRTVKIIFSLTDSILFKKNSILRALPATGWIAMLSRQSVYTSGMTLAPSTHDIDRRGDPPAEPDSQADSQPDSRRWIAVAVVVVLLHALLVQWAKDGLFSASETPQKLKPIVAQLHPLAPLVVPLAAAVSAPPAPAARPRPRPRAARAARTDLVDNSAGEPTPISAEPSGTATALPDPAAAAMPVQPDPIGKPRYQVQLPPSAELSYKLIRKEPALANPFYGKSRISWNAGQGSYSVRTEAGLTIPFGTINVFTLTSEGKIDGAGIAPVVTTESRRGRAETATHFNRDQGTITFSASTASVPLAEGAQDQATVTLQLAGIGRANADQFGQNKEIDILVGETREATLFKFVVAGQEELETELGKLSTWHVVRAPRPGSYSSRLDIWFAPALDWYPVQITNSESNGAITTQSVLEILTAGAPAVR